MGSITIASRPSGPEVSAIVVDGKSFALNGKSMSYRLHVDEATGDLMSDHFGGSVTEDPIIPGTTPPNGWSTGSSRRREFPESGKGDFRNPAVVVRHHAGFTVNHFRYQSHEVVEGKPDLTDLPGTFGEAAQVSTLIVRMYDEHSSVAADLIYSVFPEHDAIVRSVKVTNKGDLPVVVEKLSSFSIDFPHAEYDMVGLRGEWTRERNQFRRKIEYGMQSIGSTTGYSSHFYNPFLGVTSPTTTESQGDAWGFSLVYTGSFDAEVEKSPHGLVRASIGMNRDQLSWPLQPGEALASPECVAVYSSAGMGGMSRKFHKLYRKNLIKSKFVDQVRPALLNSWEGLYFDFDEAKIETLATSAAGLGVKLFVLDDGWFGVKHPRVNDKAGLGDWKVNPAKFPNGLKPLVDRVTKLPVAGADKTTIRFGLWVEPEMVNPKSELYAAHPDWVMSAGTHDRSEARTQLVLNLALPEVQASIIDSISALLADTAVSYIKWDHNRAIHESASPQSYHAYILGMYKVFDALTSRFPDILWEGCAAGGGRFDPGVLQYFPQVWTSDNMDGIDRISIQFGTSVVYPLSTMGAHVGAVPSHVTKRTQSLSFRAHVAMMGGSFGFELDPDRLPAEERAQIPGLIALAEKINPVVITGDLYRLRLPGDSNYPAAVVVAEDKSKAVLFAFQLLSTTMHENPAVKLEGLDAAARYRLDDGERVLSGATLMNGGIQFQFGGDYDSKIVFLERV